MHGGNSERKVWIAVLVGAAVIALASARPHAGGWNDGSRLATVESLVDRHTLAIDDSMFVKVASVETSPYESAILRDPRRPPSMLGTFDKLWIDGHWYSDKSPVPALLMALLYQLLQWATGLTASLHPQAFCYLMTVLSSGAAYVAAVAGIDHIATRLRLPLRLRLAVTASFALGTLALVYTRYVNNHVLLLGVTVALLACHLHLVEACLVEARRPRFGLLVALGSLAGFAYTIDLGVGPPLWLGSVLLAAWRTRSWKALALILLASLPWLAAHHAVNYATGGTFKPANAVPEYLAWPHSPFRTNLTGQWNHASVGGFASYALQLLIGKKGFLGHNLPLLLALPAGIYLLRRRSPYWPEVLYCLGAGGGVWLVYAAGSSNYAGACCSIRWFVPLVGLGYFVLILFLRAAPGAAADFGILSAGGIVLMLSAWPEGPWRLTVVPAHWPVLGLTLVAWGCYRWRVGRVRRGAVRDRDSVPMARAA
ncbi:MAG: hypothetical protein L0Y71_22885 [Gemmataceae bacterium]|nr:hypothetical protein [Gemmataceae bacterium]